MSEQQTLECNVCSCEFDLEGEGGIAGDFGIIPVAFCPTCLTSMVDMVHQMYECPLCELTFDQAYDRKSEQ
jgi:hypothetical protein